MNHLYKIVETKIIDNFFDDDQIEYLKNILNLYPQFNTPYYGTERGNDNTVLERKIFSFTLNEENDINLSKAANIISTTVKKHLGDTTVIGGAQILTAYYPYGIHTDAIFGEYEINENHYGAWTLIIPLDNYDSHTIVFNEYSSQSKMLSDYTKFNPVKDEISDDFYNQYLDHTEYRDGVRFISIDKIFKWKKNVCFAASRYKFHTSDNFPKHNIKFKQGIVVWTALPNNFKKLYL